MKIENFNEEHLKKLNLISASGELLLSKEDLDLLKQGKQTNDILLKDIELRDKTVDLNASLSVEMKNGKANIKVHPYYKQLENNQLLTEQERDYISKNTGVHNKVTNATGTVLSHGEAPYKFDEKAQDSYYVTLNTANGEETTWGVDLKEKMKEYKVGDDVTIKYTGKEPVKVNVPYYENGEKLWKEIQTNRNSFDISKFDEKQDIRNEKFLIEFDNKKNSFDIVNSKVIPKVEAINGVPLTKEKQYKLQNGEEIEQDGSTLQYSTKKQSFIQKHSKKLLVASVLMDGGMSYLIIKGVEAVEKRIEKNTQEKAKQEVAKKEVDKQYLKDLDNLKKDIDNKIRNTDDKKELVEIKDYIDKEIDVVEKRDYKESNLEERPVTDDDVQEEQKHEEDISHEDDEDMDLEMEQEDESRSVRHGRGR